MGVNKENGEEVGEWANTTTVATMAEMKNARSICTLVNKMNHLFLEPSFRSPVFSAHPTLPAGYSPPIPLSSKPISIFPNASCFRVHDSTTHMDSALTNTQEKSVYNQSSYKSCWAASGTVRSRSESSKQDDDNRRHEERPLSRKVITRVPEKEHAQHGTRESNT